MNINEAVMSHKNYEGKTLGDMYKKYKNNPTITKRLKRVEELLRKKFARNT